MDRGSGHADFAAAVRAAQQKLADPALLPSARIWREMQAAGLDHSAFGACRLQASVSRGASEAQAARVLCS